MGGSQADVRLAGVDLSNGVSRFTVIIRDRETGAETALEKIVMPMPGTITH